MRGEGRSKEQLTVRGREHADAVKKLTDRSNRVKELREAGLGITEISQKTGFGTNAVYKYLASDFSPRTYQDKGVFRDTRRNPWIYLKGTENKA
jgi:hypothetical protein